MPGMIVVIKRTVSSNIDFRSIGNIHAAMSELGG